jgi:hypothetical protein
MTCRKCNHNTVKKFGYTRNKNPALPLYILLDNVL